MSTKLLGNTLVVSDGDSLIIYSPFQGKIVRVPGDPEAEGNLYTKLCESGFFGDLPQTTAPDTDWKGFNTLTLLLTRKCNLGCSYCYASAKPEGESMPVRLALDSVDWFIAQLPGPNIRITFHGGGEPTLEKETIKAVVEHVEKIKGDRKATYVITTNGTAEKDFWDWMIAYKFGISISMDGPSEIQNRNRPLADGSESSELVENSVKYLASRNYPFSIRLTYSPADDIEEILKYFAKLGVKKVHLEPLFPHGRLYQIVSFGKKSAYDVYAPNGAELLDKFVKAIDLAKFLGMRIHNGHLIHFARGIGYFCGAASGRAMLVTHDGFLTGCLEVVDQKDSDTKTFFLGRYIAERHMFDVDLDKIKIMQKRHADYLPECQSCYARYHCAGGCSVKAVRASGDFFERDLPYCSFTKALVPHLVKRIAAESGI